MQVTITRTRTAPATKQQAPTAPAQHDGGGIKRDGLAAAGVKRERRLLAQLRRQAAQRSLDEIEEGTLAVLTAAERDRNSIIYSRDGKYMWVPLHQIGPYLNRVG